MGRKELLEKLHAISFCASVTDLVSEGCLEILILTSDGANCFWIGYDDWFVYELHKIEKVKWNVIKEKLVAGTLNKGDLQETDLYQLVEMQSSFEKVDCVELLESLKDLPESMPNSFFCLLKNESRPKFYVDENALALELKEIYSDKIESWDNMSEEELEYWHDVHNQCNGIPCCYFNKED